MYYTEYTEPFKKKLQGEDRLRESIEVKVNEIAKAAKPEELSSMGRFPYDVLVYRKNNDYRVIMQRYNFPSIDENGKKGIIFIRDIILKKDFDYQWVYKVLPELKLGRWSRVGWEIEEEVARFKEKLLENNDIIIDAAKKQPVPEELNRWLQDYKFEVKFNIYETKDWVTYANNFGKDGITERNILNFKRLFKRIYEKRIKTTLLDNNLQYVISEDDDLGIIFYQGTELLIYDGADVRMQKEAWEAKLEKCKKYIFPDSTEKIKELAFRAYPDSVLYIKDEEDAWCQIQRASGISNLSLLPEQVDFLERSPFPCYISGQAGSGKSTMLYYSFANIYYHKVAEEFVGDMLFLTENENLRRDTEIAIKGLLQSNRSFSGIPSEDIDAVGQCLSSFKDFLLKILPETSREAFNVQMYLDFSKFKDLYNLYNKQYSKRNNLASAEEVWFILSTYVYGYDVNEEVTTTETYESIIPSKFRFFDKNEFSKIIRDGLDFYKGLLSRGYWDKNLLVRKITEIYSEQLPKQYVVIFCDEAQDFSKIELELIVKLSAYLAYDLSAEGQKIPIILAGDASQTVNPTGFSERRLSQMLYEVFEKKGYKYEKENLTYRPNYNYRSVEPVVKIANAIQTYRKDVFKEITVEQEAKLKVEGKTPILYRREWLENEKNQAEYHAKFKHKSFIVPTDLNEEEDFKNDEPLLKDFLDVKSSIAAKGAEYPQAVVIGFGEAYIRRFGSLEKEPTRDFRKKFFFNKLYVAITRAQQELTIIDNGEAVEEFWKKLIPDNFNELIIDNPETFTRTLQSSEENALKNAERDLELGKKNKNIARIRVARNIFQQFGESDKTQQANAYIYELEDKSLEAAACYEKIGKFEAAAVLYFAEKDWKALRKLRLYSEQQTIRLLITNFMERDIWTESDLRTITQNKNIFASLVNEAKWRVDFVEKTLKYSNRITESQQKRYFIEMLECIVESTEMKILALIANLYFQTREYEKAIWNWDAITNEDEKGEEISITKQDFYDTYIQAKIELAKYNQEITSELEWKGEKLTRPVITELERNQLSKEILSRYQDTKTPKITRVVAYAAVLQKEYTALAEVIQITEHQEIEDKGYLTRLFEDLHRLTDDVKIKVFLEERWIKYTYTVNMPIDDLQKEYEEKFESNYQWLEEDIKAIPQIVEPIPTNPTLHYDFFEIKNFKGFKKLTIKKFGQFNLILGNNNMGKTSLLEALLFSENLSELLKKWQTINYWRSGETASKELFDELVNRENKNQSITFEVGQRRLRWVYDFYKSTLEELTAEFKVERPEVGKHLSLKNKDGSLLIREPDNSREKIINFIPFGKGYSHDLSSEYYAKIHTDRVLRKKFIEYMKVFIPNIEEISVNPEGDKIEVGEIGAERLYPIHQYGEGANKLFRILVQIFIARGGRLMIDEIDAGIHHTKFKEFWKVILKVAKAEKVQLFATTHNDECIRYFKEILEEELKDYQKDAFAITLEQHAKTGEIVALIRDFEDFEYAYDLKMTLRGRKI